VRPRRQFFADQNVVEAAITFVVSHVVAQYGKVTLDLREMLGNIDHFPHLILFASQAAVSSPNKTVLCPIDQYDEGP
jgi:hypothetical protein